MKDPNDTELNEAPSDEWLVDTNNDGVGEWMVGRLPVRTADQLSTVVGKIVAYDQAAGNRSAMLVSDTDLVFNFHTELIASVVHLGAQAGVRHSLEQPFDYVRSNLVGQIVVLEACRRWLPNVRHLVYASSSSVYGGNRKVPFGETDPTDHPVSLYAATKRADELLSHSYSHLYGLPATGLRFFTVYGPWGRPDMAYYLFTDAIARGEPVTLYNDGEMRRDFTYIDDAVDGVLAALARPPAPRDGAPHAIYNLGNSRPVPLKRFLEIIEGALGRTAEVRLAGMPPGDVLATWADPELSRRELGFEPKVPLEEGIARFVAWYREYHAL